MLPSILFVVTNIVLSSLPPASPNSLVRRETATSIPYGVCGGSALRRCPVGLCCSKDSVCGSTLAECGTGCQTPFGKCGSNILPPFIPDVISECTKPGLFALTFDDGIHHVYTSEILDILKKNNITATFFINGYNTGDITIEPRKSILSRMYAEGHQIASHSYKHTDLSTLNPTEIHREMEINDQAIQSVIGVRPVYMRPPFGNFKEVTVTTLRSL
ncbi:MAG: hypothetical protein EHM20_18140, partial [Alphaproteobacteria bacterium]